MSKRQRAPSEPVMDPGAQPWRVEVVDAPDPDRPNATIRRAQRRDPIKGMLGRGMIETAHFNAAERVRSCHELSQGAREGGAPGRLEPWQRCHYQDRVADARNELVASIQAVGLRLGEPFRMAVLEYQPLRDIDRTLRLRSGTAEDLVVEALERLLDYQSGTGP